MTIKTEVLDRAAFLLCYGGKLVEIEGKYPKCIFTVKAPRFSFWLERHAGWIPYRRFCEKRRVIKTKSRKHSGLPERFTGDKKEGFGFEEVARFSVA